MSKNNCNLCGQPMPVGEEMFNYHGYSGPCPAPPIQKPSPSGGGDREEVERLRGAAVRTIQAMEAYHDHVARKHGNQCRRPCLACEIERDLSSALRTTPAPPAGEGERWQIDFCAALENVMKDLKRGPLPHGIGEFSFSELERTYNNALTFLRNIPTPQRETEGGEKI